ncbi:Hia/Hsf adhesin N-terminal domain-containing protein [Neisseria bergeri]|uniref:Hia/Hsf adhesin N-terminal domain-containing protein n=1 Tax=Neisseria bergeri TaxID=1906581 RepID=UPI00272C4EED|nr:Hia/Hsf adhesin N-terminal domain-containing protein [Neisseria bergeri]
MNKIYRIIWNSALNAWVVVSELTRNHTKRASATAAVAVLATLLSATAQASTNGSGGGNVPDTNFDPDNPSFTDDYKTEDESSNTNYKFGLVVVGKDGTTKTDFGSTDNDQGKVTISVENSEGSEARPQYKSSYLYLREDGGIEIDQEGRSAKFKVKAGDGLKIGNDDKLVADTTTLTVTNGKVTASTSDDDKKKLVNAENLATTLNDLGWQLKTTNGAAAAGNGTTSTVKSGDEVEFKGEDGVTVTSSTTNGKHTVTIRAAQTKDANKGGSWKITAAAEGTGEVDPANNPPTEQEVNTGEKVTLKAGDNLKIKQNGKDFTYSLKKELKDLTSVEFKDANGGTDSATTKITKDGLTITPANGAAAGATTPNANTISVTTSGISAGSKEITNVKSGLKTYKDSQNGVTQPTANSVEDAKKDLVNLTNPATGTGIAGTTTVADSTAATVGDLRGLGWVLSSDKTTDNNGTEFHAAIKNATEVEFVGKNGATVSAKTTNGKHTVTVDVATVEAGKGLEKDTTTTSNTIKLKIKSKAGEENLLTVSNDGVSVTKGEFNTVTTDATAADANTNERGKVTVKASANGTPDDTDNKKVATVGDVAKAINDAATFVKVESTTDDIEDGTANGNTADDQALKAGDTLTFKAGKNLKAKLDKGGKSVTFALAKSIETDSATLSEKLSIGKGADKVDITSDADGLKLAKAGNGNVHLNGLDSTLPDVTTNTGSSTSVTFSPSEIEKTRAATLKDVLNAGWNIKGAKVAGGNTENVDLVAGYDNVEFITGDKNTLDVVLTAKDNGKTTEVKFTPKTSVIKEKDGKLVTGQNGKDNAKPDATNDNDTGTGLVTAKAVIDAVNKSGWRVTGEGTTAETGATAVNANSPETVTSGTSVNFKNGNATTATVSKDNAGNINVKYDVNTGDGLKLDNQKITVDTGDGLKIGDDKKITVNTGDGLKVDNQKIVADTTTLTVTDGKVTAPDATNGNGKKLVNAGDLVDALNKLSWKAKAEADTDGEVEPTANQTPQEVKAGETVTFKAGKNLKVKQSGKDFTYSLKDELAGLTSITLGTAGNGKTTTKITENGLTVSTTPANGGTATEVKIGSDGISAGNKAITNVASGLKTYGDNQANAAGQAGNPVATAKNGLIDLSQPNTGAAGTGTSVADTTAATVGDLRKLGWVLSADKTTDNNGTAFHAAVKNAEEVEFKGTGKATVSAKTENGKHTVTIDVAETKIEASDGIEKTNDDKLKLKVKTGDDNLLTVGTAGASVAKGKLEVVSTTANSDKKGQVKAKSANGTDATDKDVATVKDVADAINKAETFVKVENTTDDIEDAAANGADNAEEALKAGDTLTFKAGKNLKAKLDKTGKSVTFALAKSIETDSATLSKTLSIGENGNKVNITSDTKGLNFAKETAGTNGDTTVHLNGIGSTLHDTLSNTGVTTNLNGNVTDDEKKRAASVRDVLNVGWNIKGVKSNSATKQSENVDFVRTYDTVEFLSGSEETTTVTVDSEDNGKTTKVKIGAKTSVIAAKDGKLVTGKDNKANGGTNASEADNTDEGNGLVTAKAVIDAVNKAGWRIKTTAANGQAGQAGDNFETVTSGTNVTFADGNVTKATVSKNAQSGAITVKYDVNVGDGWKIDDTSKKIVADTTALTVNSGNEADKPKGKVADVADDSKNKLVKAGDLVTALNSLSWTATAGKDGTGEVEPTTLTEQEVKAGDKVTFKAGDNLKVKQSGKDFTYSLKKDLKDLTSVEFKDANGGTNGASTKITKDGLTITPANGANGAAATDADKIKVASDGISAGNKAVKNVVSGLKKFNPANPIVGKDLDNITKNADDAYKGLTNLDEKDVDKQTLAVADNTAATVGDLRGLGWVISADKTTGGSKEYHDQVRNANEVKFKSGNGISVSGKTVNGRREITFELAKGEVVKSNEFTAPDGTNLVKVGDKYYSKEDIDPTTGKPMTGKTEKYKVENGKVVSADGNKTEVTLTNKGSGYVTGNQVADAIAKSGFELGLANEADAKAAFDDKTKALSDTKAETVNANDKVRFADGKHTKVSAATVESIDANGEKVTTTFVKTDVELPLTQIYNTDANGKKITKVVANGQTKWYELKDNGSTDMDKEVTLGNVDSDGKKVVKDNDKWYHAKADGTADTSTQAVDNSKVSTDEKHVVSLDPNNQSNGKGVVIDNVANGDISPNSKQAVNGSQIFALTGNKTPNITSITVDKDGKTVNVGTAGNANDTNKTYHNVVVGEDGKTPLLTTYNVEGRKEVITNSVVEAIYNMNEQGIKFFHSNDGKATSRIERSNEIDSSASGKFATAIGAKADAAGENAIAFGYGSKALRDNTVAIGTGNVVNAEKSGAFGDPNYIEDGASGSYAFGNDNRITSKNTFVLGNSVNAKRDANGNVLTEEKEIIGKDGNKTTEKVPQALGKTVENSVYLGNASTATENPGSNLKSDGTAGNTTTAGATGTVNGFAGATAHGAVSVGASGEERRIQNVAAGEISATSTDAINGSQLYAATKGIADQAVGMVRALKRELEGVAAGANAAAALPQSYLPGKSMISAATGAYGSTGALAVGYSSISDNGKWVVKGQLNINTRSKAGGGVGVGYIW